ncbi:unnamed protein product [Prorocentrum cordatum]|uniref:Calmodulin-lysine N-methyltransferase n=1 Tax=Prorocentrum cordatum TaxID=2364126 RepID=A0ABN9UKI3_9DINO|nr:unnamed protein product [Polarella glacialis]
MERCFGGGPGLHPKYELCCTCQNHLLARDERSQDAACFPPPLSFEACCVFYGPAERLPYLPCWRLRGEAVRRVAVELGGRAWALPQEPEPPFQNEGVMDAVLWPSAYALGAWLAQQPPSALQGRRAIELGAGLALPSISEGAGQAPRTRFGG